ncbi:MAG: ABC transporter ATP-binding protein [Clostridia bacterium]|nr:ABC transporter ATP-binding protein [Clostridia bacterium]
MENNTPQPEQQAAPAIDLTDVVKIYSLGGTKLRALDGVSLKIWPGEFACIIGRSGSGKSTLLNMMAGLEKPSGGVIRVAGKRIERMNERALVQFRLKNIGFVFQSFNLFATQSALDNVAAPLMYRGVRRSVRRKRAAKMLEAVGLKSHMHHTPGRMSGGQQQRVGIARALVAAPKILFADEPTGNLDLKTSREILKLIRDACKEKGTTLIVVTHDPEMAQFADHVIQLLDGHVIEDRQNPEPTPIPVIGETPPEGTAPASGEADAPPAEASPPAGESPAASTEESSQK